MDAGKLLHDARWMAGLTQAEVAQRAGITQQTVALYERGARQPSLPTLSRLVAGCGLELAWRLIPRATAVAMPGLEFPLLVASPDDCTRWWLDRDLDHLALQRAIRLAS